MLRLASLALALSLLGACGDKEDGDDSAGGGDDGASTEGCPGLCTGAGFSDGTETDFGGGVIECVCEGSGDGIEEADCDAYCDAFGVSAENALLSSESSDNDKCVCDGTQER